MGLSLGKYPGSDIEFYSMSDLISSQNNIPDGVITRLKSMSGAIIWLSEKYEGLWINPIGQIRIPAKHLTDSDLNIVTGPTGVVVDSTGLILTTDGANPEVRLTLQFAGAQDLIPLMSRISVEVDISVTTEDFGGGTADPKNNLRFGIRTAPAGEVSNFYEAYLSNTALNEWLPVAATEISATYSSANGLSDIVTAWKTLELETQLNQSTSPAIPTIWSWASKDISSFQRWGAGRITPALGFNWITSPNQGLRDIHIFAESGGSGEATCTVKSIILDPCIRHDQ